MALFLGVAAITFFLAGLRRKSHRRSAMSQEGSFAQDMPSDSPSDAESRRGMMQRMKFVWRSSNSSLMGRSQTDGDNVSATESDSIPYSQRADDVEALNKDELFGDPFAFADWRNTTESELSESIRGSSNLERANSWREALEKIFAKNRAEEARESEDGWPESISQDAEGLATQQEVNPYIDDDGSSSSSSSSSSSISSSSDSDSDSGSDEESNEEVSESKKSVSFAPTVSFAQFSVHGDAVLCDEHERGEITLAPSQSLLYQDAGYFGDVNDNAS